MRRYTPLILLVVIPLILVSCGKTDDVVVAPISTVTPQYPTYTREQLEAMSAEADKKVFSVNSGSIDDLTSYLQGGSRNISELIASLIGSDTETVSKRAYLRSYMGDYSGALAERDALCKTDTTQCAKYGITLDIASTVDQSGTVISAPNVYLNGQPLSIESSVVQPKAYDDMMYRVRVEKEGYLDSYQKLDGAETGIKNFAVNPVMAKADLEVDIDNSVGGTYTAGVGTGAITYTIAPDTFTDGDGKLAKGMVHVYLFALGKNDSALSTFNLDVFSNSGVAIGNRMVTDGMPFVTAYQDGKVLKITKPIEGIGIIEPSTTAPSFESVPKNIWLNPSELQEYGLPGFWSLNRDSGVWVESQMQILDNTGRYKFNFR